MTWKGWPGWAGFVLGLLLGGAAVLPALGVVADHERAAANLILFYHPPRDGTPVQTVAERFGALVLTAGDEPYRDELRAAGFRGPVLQYLLANETSGPPAVGGAAEPCDEYVYHRNNASGLAGDFCAALHGDERNFLHNGRGERLHSFQCARAGEPDSLTTLYVMNPAAPAWRAYFIQRAKENLEGLGYTGLFLDNIDASPFRARRQQANSDGVVQEYESDAAFRDAVVGYLAELREQLGGATLWANLTGDYDADTEWGPYLPYLDGVMNEYFVAQWAGTYVDPATWEHQVRQAEGALGRGLVFSGVAQGPRDDAGRMRFALATYLLVAGERAYFRYADATAPESNLGHGCAAPSRYREAWLYDEYRARLGWPLGGRYRAGDLWRRDFACGQVTVDVANRVGTIVADPSAIGCLGGVLPLR